jgi:hypothetical protein
MNEHTRLGSLVEPLADESCPTCGRSVPHPANRFSTGQVADPSGVREADAVPDPDGPEGYEVITRLARGEEVAYIAASMDLTRAQVEGLKPFINTAANIKVGEY